MEEKERDQCFKQLLDHHPVGVPDNSGSWEMMTTFSRWSCWILLMLTWTFHLDFHLWIDWTRCLMLLKFELVPMRDLVAVYLCFRAFCSVTTIPTSCHRKSKLKVCKSQKGSLDWHISVEIRARNMACKPVCHTGNPERLRIADQFTFQLWATMCEEGESLHLKISGLNGQDTVEQSGFYLCLLSPELPARVLDKHMLTQDTLC